MDAYRGRLLIFDSKFNFIIVKTITWIHVNLSNQASHSARIIEISAPGHNVCTCVRFQVCCKNELHMYTKWSIFTFAFLQMSSEYIVHLGQIQLKYNEYMHFFKVTI